MAYNKTSWIHGKTVITAENMNKIEDGIESAIAKSAESQNILNEIISNAPESLDTFKEIADAIGNDANFANTIDNKISTLKSEIMSGLDKILEALA